MLTESTRHTPLQCRRHQPLKHFTVDTMVSAIVLDSGNMTIKNAISKFGIDLFAPDDARVSRTSLGSTESVASDKIVWTRCDRGDYGIT